jgi:hypothetical protein
VVPAQARLLEGDVCQALYFRDAVAQRVEGALPIGVAAARFADWRVCSFTSFYYFTETVVRWTFQR